MPLGPVLLSGKQPPPWIVDNRASFDPAFEDPWKHSIGSRGLRDNGSSGGGERCAGPKASERARIGQGSGVRKRGGYSWAANETLPSECLAQTSSRVADRTSLRRRGKELQACSAGTTILRTKSRKCVCVCMVETFSFCLFHAVPRSIAQSDVATSPTLLKPRRNNYWELWSICSCLQLVLQHSSLAVHTRSNGQRFANGNGKPLHVSLTICPAVPRNSTAELENPR